MTDPLDLSVLIPARNEVENLPSLLMEIRAALAAEEPEHLTVACRAGGLRQWLARRPERPALEMLQSGNWFIPPVEPPHRRDRRLAVPGHLPELQHPAHRADRQLPVPMGGAGFLMRGVACAPAGVDRPGRWRSGAGLPQRNFAGRVVCGGCRCRQRPLPNRCPGSRLPLCLGRRARRSLKPAPPSCYGVAVPAGGSSCSTSLVYAHSFNTWSGWSLRRVP